MQPEECSRLTEVKTLFKTKTMKPRLNTYMELNIETFKSSYFVTASLNIVLLF